MARLNPEQTMLLASFEAKEQRLAGSPMSAETTVNRAVDELYLQGFSFDEVYAYYRLAQNELIRTSVELGQL